MDRRSVVAAAPPAQAVTVDQAVFTSIRSPLGQGYRIVAASGGIAVDEKREINQRAPSHGNLCDPSPAGSGLATFRMRSGRQCVFLSRNVGAERSGRGGCRVHTHVLILTPEGFRSFARDPFAVVEALPSGLCEELLRSLPTRLASLSLSPQQALQRAWPALPGPRGADADRMTSILAALLDGRRLLVVGAPAPADALRLTLGAIPLAERWLSASYGLRFSAARQFQLVFVDVNNQEARPLVRDCGVQVFDWESAAGRTESVAGEWLGLVTRLWKLGRHADLRWLAAELPEQAPTALLEDVATLCETIERVGNADAELVDELSSRYANRIPACAAHARLLDEFNEAVEARRASLTAPPHDGVRP